MNERIKELRSELLNLSQEQFGERIGLSKSGISNIESGVRNVTDKHIKLICSEFDVREEWIRTGSGDPFVRTTAAVMDQLRLKYSLNDFDYNFVYEYLKLSPERRAAVREFFRNVVAAEDGQHEESTAERIDREVAEYRQELELEARQAEGLSAFGDDAAKKNA
ncbi:helix-turn-helix domain-containing protein [Blautia schinkii]|nr:helix-turn-helix domain-containing protein [Blautia schinkii]